MGKVRSSLCVSYLSTSTVSTGSTASTTSYESTTSTSTNVSRTARVSRRFSLYTTPDHASQTLEGWIYWQRDVANARCWTKVYSVVQNEFLYFFQSARKSKPVLVQIAVSTVEQSGDRQLRIVDPTGEALEIWLMDETSLLSWRSRLQEAAVLTASHFAAFPVPVKGLPRNSIYRGSLASDRRVKKRTRCKIILTRLASKVGRPFRTRDRNTI